MPRFLQERIVENVESGGTLVVLGGLFTLDRGCFRGGKLHRILPIALPEGFGSRPADNPLSLEAEDQKLAARLTSAPVAPAALWYHGTELTEGARTLVAAGKVPFLAIRPHGKGQVVLVNGMRCGAFGEGIVPFWKWEKWPDFLAEVIRRNSERF